MQQMTESKAQPCFMPLTMNDNDAGKMAKETLYRHLRRDKWKEIDDRDDDEPLPFFQ